MITFHKYLVDLTWLVEKFRTFYNILPLFGGNLLVTGAISLSVWTRMIFFRKIVAVEPRIPTTPWFAESFVILPHLPISKRPGGCPWPNRVIQLALEKAAPSGDALQECFRWRKKLHHTQRCGATNHANQQSGKGDPMKMSREGHICCVEQRITNSPKSLSLLQSIASSTMKYRFAMCTFPDLQAFNRSRLPTFWLHLLLKLCLITTLHDASPPNILQAYSAEAKRASRMVPRTPGWALALLDVNSNPRPRMTRAAIWCTRPGGPDSLAMPWHWFSQGRNP